MFAATKHAMTGAGLKPVNLKSGVAVPATGSGAITGMTAGDVSVGFLSAAGYNGYVTNGYTEIGSSYVGGSSVLASRKFSVTTGDTAAYSHISGAGSGDFSFALVFENAKTVTAAPMGLWYYTYKPGSQLLFYANMGGLSGNAVASMPTGWTRLFWPGSYSGNKADVWKFDVLPGGGTAVHNQAAWASWHQMIEISNQ